MEISSEYLDEKDALKRVGGNKGLYKKLLGQLIDGGHIDSLEQALEAGDIETAARGAHSIKGIGANLSLPKLTAAALELELKLKNKEDYEESLKSLKDTYDITSENIAAFCKEE